MSKLLTIVVNIHDDPNNTSTIELVDYDHRFACEHLRQIGKRVARATRKSVGMIPPKPGGRLT